MSQQTRTRRRALELRLALAIVCSLAATQCGPQVATPLPEPPSIDGGKIGLDDMGAVTTLSEPHPLPITGRPGAVTPGSIVRVLNLDEANAAVSAQADADGAFEITVLVSNGDELRFQAVQNGVRSEPADFIHGSVAGPDALTPSPRHACVVLQPGLELRYDELGPRPLRVLNDCADPLSLAAPRFRLGDGEFEIELESESELPLVVPPASEATLDINLLELPPPAREDVLFIDFSVAGETIRYPIGLYAPAPTD